MRKEDVLACWKESLTLLKWSEFKLILLASLNNFRRSLVILCKKFWWLLGINFLLCLFLFPAANIILSKSTQTQPLWFLLLLFLMLLDTLLFIFSSGALVYLFFLTTRASLEAKDYVYYRTYSSFSRVVPFFTTILCCWLICSLFFVPFSAILALIFSPSSLKNSLLLTLFASFFISHSCFFSGFFILDNKPSAIFSSIKRGFLLFFYFFPLLIPIHLLLFLPANCFIPPLGKNIDFIPLLISQLLFLLLHCLFLSYVSVIYTKIKHAHHNLFFE